MKDVLEGQNVRLEIFDAAKHAKALYAELCEKQENSEIWTLQPYGPFASENDFTEFFKDDFAQDDIHAYVIIKREDNQPYGLCAYCDIAPGHKRLEIGDVTYSLALQKTREATEAIHLLLQQAFELGYRRCAWKCNAKNEDSEKAALRLGFTYEGLFRNHRWEKGQNRDTKWFSMIEEDWPKICASHESWLNPNNFDENGQQKKRLQEFF